MRRSPMRPAVVGIVLVVALAASAYVRESQQTADLGQASETPAAVEPTPSPPAATPTPAPTPAPTPEPRWPPGPAVNLAQLRRTAPQAPSPWPWGVEPSPHRGHRVCADAEQPKASTHATFARSDGSASLTPDIITVICAAAPRASLKVAIYYIENNGEDVQRILDALSFVARRRAVDIRIVADKRRADFSSDFGPTADQLRAIAAVRNCLDGCRSELPPRGVKGGSPEVEVQHHKFMVLSDTYAGGRPAPMVWTASANWSDKQLHNKSQSGLVLRDRGVAAAFALRFDDLETCARHGCRAWNRIVRKRGLPPDTHGVVRRGGIWFDRREQRRAGSPRGGSSVMFSPWLEGDPVAAHLRSLRCNAKHDTIWVAQRVFGRSRNAVATALADLDRQGCDVRVIVSWSSIRVAPTFAVGYLHLRQLGLEVGCVRGVHDKFLLIDAINAADGTRAKSITAGSQGMLMRALRYSDEALVTLTTADTSRKAGRANKAVWRAYKHHFEDLEDQRRSCPV